jgi:hypothetical protein
LIARCGLDTFAGHPEGIKLETAVVGALEERVEIKIFQDVTVDITIESPDAIIALPFLLALRSN